MRSWCWGGFERRAMWGVVVCGVAVSLWRCHPHEQRAPAPAPESVPVPAQSDALTGPGDGGRATQTLVGVLEIQPIMEGKASQGVTLHAEDGSAHGIDMRYNANHLLHANKRVKVTGYYTSTSTPSSPQGYRYFHIERIALAEGELPHAPPLKAVPAPPVVRSRAEIDALQGHWAVAFGEATYTWQGGDPKSGIIEVARVKLSDGYTLTKHLYRAAGPRPKPEPVALMIEVSQPEKPSVRRFCFGHVRRCGMEDAP